MKKYILGTLFVLGTLVSCSKEEITNTTDTTETNQADKMELMPQITVTKNNQEVNLQEVFSNGVITLEEGENYHISVTFPVEVSLEKGEYLKFKSLTAKDYFADFYGKNNKPIAETVVFRAEGYQPYTLQVQQNAVVAKNVLSVKAINIKSRNPIGERIVSLGEDMKTVYLINSLSANSIRFYGSNVDIELSFLSAVVLENVAGDNETQPLVRATATNDPRVWKLNVSLDQLRQDPQAEITVPVYQSVNGEKGDKLFDVTLKGDFAPYLVYYINRRSTYNSFDMIEVESGSDQRDQIYRIEFKVQGEANLGIIENVNEDLVQSFGIQQSGDYWEIQLKTDQMSNITQEPIRLFDVYEAAANASRTNLVKKENAQKREIFIKLK